MSNTQKLLKWLGVARPAEQWRNDWEGVANILMNNSIECFYHFTDRSNLGSIFENGLLSKGELRRKQITPPVSVGGPTSEMLDERSGTFDDVHLAFRSDPPMLRAKVKDKTLSDAVWLKLDVTTALFKNVRWCGKNSTANGANISDSISVLGEFQFDLITKAQAAAYRTKEWDWQQAELLFPKEIPKDQILNWSELGFDLVELCIENRLDRISNTSKVNRPRPAKNPKSKSANTYGILVLCLVVLVVTAFIRISKLDLSSPLDSQATAPAPTVGSESQTSTPKKSAELKTTQKSYGSKFLESEDKKQTKTQGASRKLEPPISQSKKPAVSKATKERYRSVTPDSKGKNRSKIENVELPKLVGESSRSNKPSVTTSAQERYRNKISDLERELRLKLAEYQRYKNVPNSQKPRSVIELGREIKKLDDRLSDLKRQKR